jgi:hypothetical protein
MQEKAARRAGYSVWQAGKGCKKNRKFCRTDKKAARRGAN